MLHLVHRRVILSRNYNSKAATNRLEDWKKDSQAGKIRLIAGTEKTQRETREDSKAGKQRLQ